MKTLSITNAALACALGLGAFASSAPVSAQDHHTVVVQVPFAFETGSKTMPAGKYSIDMANEHLIMLRGSVSNSAAFESTIPEIKTTAPSYGKVVFHRYGDRYFLSDVWIAGDTTGRQCLRSKREKALQVAQNPSASNGTEVALNVLPQ